MPHPAPVRKPRGCWERACYLLESHGIDPSLTFPEDWDSQRYWNVQTDEWVEWPESFRGSGFDKLQAEIQRVQVEYDFPPAYGDARGEWPQTAETLTSIALDF